MRVFKYCETILDNRYVQGRQVKITATNGTATMVRLTGTSTFSTSSPALTSDKFHLIRYKTLALIIREKLWHSSLNLLLHLSLDKN